MLTCGHAQHKDPIRYGQCQSKARFTPRQHPPNTTRKELAQWRRSLQVGWINDKWKWFAWLPSTVLTFKTTACLLLPEELWKSHIVATALPLVYPSLNFKPDSQAQIEITANPFGDHSGITARPKVSPALIWHRLVLPPLLRTSSSITCVVRYTPR